MIARERTHLSVARLTIGREDGADDFMEFCAAVGTSGGLCAAGDAYGLSARSDTDCCAG